MTVLELVMLAVGAALLLAVALTLTPVLGSVRASSALRAAVAGAGMLFVIAGVILLVDDGSGASGQVKVVVHDALGPGEVSENATLTLAGHRVGVFRLGAHAPSARLVATVAKAGEYGYTLAVERQLKGRQPATVDSRGQVEIDGRGHLEVVGDQTGRTGLLPVP